MRLLALTTSYPRHRQDYCGRFVHDLHAGLRTLGHSVVTIAPAAVDAPSEGEDEAGRVLRPGPVEQIFYRRGLEAELLRRPWRGLHLMRWHRTARVALTREARAADALLLHWVVPGVWALPRGHNLPVVGIGHGADLHQLELPLLGRFHGLSLKGRVHALLTTRRLPQKLVKNLFGDIPLLSTPMGVDTNVFCKAGPEHLEDRGALLGVGRFESMKGFDVLLRAAALTGDRVVLAGAGPCGAALRELAQQLQVPLQMPGILAPEGVAAAMRAARAVVIPSRPGRGGREEGVPVVAAEALSVGRPLFASSTGGLAQWLPESCLFPVGDAGALAILLRAPQVSVAVPEWTDRVHTARCVQCLLQSTRSMG